MRRMLGGLLGSLAVAAGALPVAAALPVPGADATELAAQLRPIDLRVFSGEGAWQAENDFWLEWERPPVAEHGFPITGIGYRVHNAAEAVFGETRRAWDNSSSNVGGIQVPSRPGAYTADFWLEGPGGERGPEVSTTLRLDYVRPNRAQPLAPAEWVSGASAAVVTIEHPAAPQPISGIRGYAVSVDRGGASSPCAGSSRCNVAETDLRDGIDGDTISLGTLPEGAHVVRAVAVSGSGMRSVEAGSAIVRVDATLPEVALEGVPRDWASGPVRVAASATDALSGMAANGPGGPFTAIAIDGGVPRVEPGGAAAVTVTGEGAHRISFYGRDAAGNVDDQMPRTATVRIDESPPEVAFARAQDPAEPERIEVAVADSLSGPDPARGSIALRPAGSRQRFEPLPTAVSAGRLLARWDSDAFPVGTYELRATGYDAAGNATSSDRRGDGARMVLANPLKTVTEIQAGFGGRRLAWHRCAREEGRRRCRRQAVRSLELGPRTRVVPYGHDISFGGRLTSTSGSPLAGLPVRVVETFDPGAGSSQRSTTVQTAADGSFLTRLQPGPNRRVEAVFAGNRVLARAGGEQARLEVLGGVRLRASSSSARVGGGPVIFRGSVGDLGAPLPAGGRPVELQFRVAAGDWSEFRTVHTDTHGRFRYAYAFSDDDSRGIRFQFRAYVLGGDWPYEPTASKPVMVTGR